MNMALWNISLIWEVHDGFPEFHKELSLKWLGEEVSYHLGCGTVLN